MANNIYVGGFPYKTTKEELAKLFSACGTVLSAKVILDRDTGRPKGFGFIEMSTDDEAKVAVEKLNGSFIGDRKIFVVEGRVDKTRPQGRFAGGESPTPKPSFAPKTAGDSPKANRPGFVERRTGKDRRGQPAGAPPDRRETPASPSASAPSAPAARPWEKKPFEKKAWVKKPFDGSDSPQANRKPWVKKPFDAEKKPWVKKPFDGEKKPFGDSPQANRKPWVKKPFDPTKKAWTKKPGEGDKKPWAKKPFDRKPPVRGAKWTPKKD